VSSGFFVQLLSLNPEQAWEAFNDVGKWMRRPPSTEMKERGDLGKQKDVSSQTVEISLSTRTKTLGWSASGEKDGLVKVIVAKERGEKATGLTGSKKSRRCNGTDRG
jgi:hypothetical protein